MPRSARLEFPGACYHVINRGNYRRELFRGEDAAAAGSKVSRTPGSSRPDTQSERKLGPMVLC